MGCDIHTLVEFKRGRAWHPHPGPWLCYHCDGEGPLLTKRGERECFSCINTGVSDRPWRVRNYDVFGMLAGVRVDDWKIISRDRDLPRDIATPVVDGDDETWLGDHSFGYVTLAELQAYEWWQTATKSGCVGMSLYARWNHITPPPFYSGGVGGGGIQHMTCKQADEYLKTHPAPPPCYDYFEPSNIYITDAEWLETAAQRAGNFITFIAEMTNAAKLLDVAPINLRLVFGFDS